MDERTQELQDAINEYVGTIADDLDATSVAVLANFEAAIATEDTLGIWIRAHLYIENELTKCLRAMMPHYDTWGQSDPPFASKLSLLYALGALSHDDWRGYKQFNKLRNNSAAHASVEKGMPDITAVDVRRLWNSIDISLRDKYSSMYFDEVNFQDSLRSIVTALVANLFVISDLLREEESRYDWLRYQSTGESVISRTKKGVESQQLDSGPVREVKAAIAELNSDDRLNVREWMREDVERADPKPVCECGPRKPGAESTIKGRVTATISQRSVTSFS